jgi:hypothetical protein
MELCHAENDMFRGAARDADKYNYAAGEYASGNAQRASFRS